MIIDTHTHLYAEEFSGDQDIVITRALGQGVDKMVMPNVDMDSVKSLHLLCDRYPLVCFPAMGLHPTSVTENWQEDLRVLKSWFERRKYVAVGEVGIDLYWDQSFRTQQMDAFCEQLNWCSEFHLPVIIHSRNAFRETIDCIKAVGNPSLQGVFHSFGGTVDEANEIFSLGQFMLGINGIVTFKKSTLPEVLSHIDLRHIIVETDSPYLAPVPFRGKRNESAYITHTVAKLAEIYESDSSEVAAVTSANAISLFALN